MEHSTGCELYDSFIPNVCVVTGGGRSGGVVTVAEGGMDDVPGGMMAREGGDGY